MDITNLIPIELFNMLFNIINDNTINIISLAYVNKFFHKNISIYAKNNKISKISDCKYAALTNRIEMLKWAIDLSFHLDNQTCEVAAVKGNVEMLKYLLNDKQRIKSLWNIGIVNKAALCGHMGVVKWILNNVDSSLLDASKYENTIKNEVLMICGHNALINEYDHVIKEYKLTLCNYAAQSGNLDLVVFLSEYRFTPSYDTFNRAVVGGHIHILEWLKKTQL